MRKFFLLVVALLSFVVGVLADEVSFEVGVPRVVAVGKPFSVEFSVNAKAKDFTAPSFEGFDVLAGPSKGSSSSVQFINGQMTKSEIHSYTYVVVCSAEGEYTIGSAGVKVEGKEYKTKPTTVKAIVEKGSAGQQSGGGGQQSRPQSGGQQQGGSQQSRAPQVAADDVMIRAIVNRTNVYKGEPVRVVYKIYTRVGLAGIDGQKIPSFAGFWTQRLNIDANRWEREEVGGKIYDACPLGEYLLFPQQSGTLTVDPMELSAVVHLQVQRQGMSNNPFADFFGPQIEEVRIPIKSKPVTVNVKALPEGAPASFSGAVGEYEMEVTPPNDDIVANSAVTYTVRISGRGNLSMIQAPQVELPTSFEQYSVKSSESIQATSSGVSGYRQFEYPMIARADGDFLIPALEFTYFNPKLAKYVTLSSAEYMIHVTPDDKAASVGPNAGLVSGISKEDIKFLGRDIRFIKLGAPKLVPDGKTFMFSGLWWLIVVVMVGLAVGITAWLRSYLKEMRNQATLKGKRANKVALQRLRAAERYMNEQNTRGFYEEMLRALWGYMSDKLNIPVADLTKESVRERLARKGVEAEDVEQYVAVISDCEYAQYAPSGSGHMKDAYLVSVEIISKLEAVINK